MAENTFASRIETLEEKVFNLESVVAKLLKELNKLKKANAPVKEKAEVVELPVEKKKRTTKKKATVKE